MSRIGLKVMWMAGAGVCGLALAAAPVFAREGHGQGHKDPAKYIEMLDKKLKLSDEQRSQIERIIADYQTRTQALHEQLEALHTEKRQKINAALTPAQQAQYEQMKSGHKKHGRHGWRKNEHDDDKHEHEGKDDDDA